MNASSFALKFSQLFHYYADILVSMRASATLTT